MRTMRVIWIVLFCLMMTTAALAEAEKPDEFAALPGDLLQQILTAETAWLDFLEASPAIYLLKMPTGDEVSAIEDKWRFHVVELREKAKSNRAWHAYWSKQAELVEKLTPIYKKAIDAAGDHEKLQADKVKYQVRLDAVSAWQTLCKDKMANQDSYLKAIDQEKEAFEKRLDAATRAKAAVKTAEVSADIAKEGEGEGWLSDGDGASPYAAHKRVKHELEHQRFLQEQKGNDAQSDHDMADSLLSASQVMLLTQRSDLKLAQREANLAKKQAAAAGTDKDWRRTWRQIRKKTAEKMPLLEKVIENQQKRVSTLHNEKAYFAAMVEIKGARTKDIERQLEAHASGFYKAILLTAGDVVLKKGLIVLGFLLAAWLCVKLIARIGRAVKIRVQDDDPDRQNEQEKTAETLVNVFSGIARFAVYLVVGLLLLDALGVNVKPLMGAFAIFGLAISFGSQNLVKDVVTGMFILLENQVSVGDVVQAAGKSGSVEKVSLRRLVLRDIHGTAHHIPHGQVSTLSNLTQSWSRAIVHIGVGYGSDLRKVQEIFNETGRLMFAEPQWQDMLLEAPSVVGVTELADSSVNFRVWAKVVPGAQWGIERELNVLLYEACDKHGIEIPFPQHVVELKNPEGLTPK